MSTTTPDPTILKSEMEGRLAQMTALSNALEVAGAERTLADLKVAILARELDELCADTRTFAEANGASADIVQGIDAVAASVATLASRRP
jgi:hypothetical protein